MKKGLPGVLFMSIFIVSSITIYGQNNRLKEVNQTSVINDFSGVKTYPNIEEKKTAPARYSDANASPSPNPSKVIPEQPTNSRTYSSREEFKKRKAAEEKKSSSNIENIENNTPLYPDFKVIATQEQPYENNMVLKEKTPEQMVSVRPVMKGDEEAKNTNINNPDNFTISPLKRKYFEGIVSELEKEIQQDPNNTGSEMMAKKKELEDLKKLLTH